MKNHVIKRGFLAGTVVLTAVTAHAYDLPTVNLGMTSFLDGGLPAGPGWYSQTYFQNYDSNKLMDHQGNQLPLPKTDLNYQVLVEQVSYMSNIRIGDHAALGLNVLIPFVSKMAMNDGLNNAAIKAQGGFGDLMIGPFIQFDPVMGQHGPKFVQRIELQVNLPTGNYDRQKNINPGNNAVSLDPYWAATYWFNPKWTASTRIHYLYNFKNDDPNYSYATADDIQAGQAIHANFATDYAITPQLRLGLNGYWLKQITDNKVNDEKMKDTREQVWAIGPGAMYSFSKNDHVVANAYFEQNAKNRPEGTRLQLRYIHHF
ncbi:MULTISPECIES: transporter [unclassified Acinetobacter]|uniref:SphA family protein n=1 Tax=unclassified Acinetobacter TaxID=196816 RepID=UPI0029349A90|nr:MULTISPECIES: transporter [unclassified Acinetobacter]WOE31496.1 transporter [Acinetobacter sp. SAAs470]WOE39692.1 transporter [Acinetobacter sp. SAAs474]